jgi:hypothetical protein
MIDRSRAVIGRMWVDGRPITGGDRPDVGRWSTDHGL